MRKLLFLTIMVLFSSPAHADTLMVPVKKVVCAYMMHCTKAFEACLEGIAEWPGPDGDYSVLDEEIDVCAKRYPVEERQQP